MAKDGSITHLLVIFLGITLISSSVTTFSSPVLAAAPGTFIDDFVSSGSGGLDIPKNLAFGPDGNLYVISFAHDKVKRYDGSTGAYIDIFVASGDGGLDGPQGLEFGPDDNLYITSEYTNEVLRYDGSTGAFMDVFVAASGDLSNPQEAIFGPDGNLFVSNYVTDSVVRFDGTSGSFIDVFVTAGSGGLDRAQGLAFGPDGNLYVASENTDEILRYNGVTGAFIDIFATPSGMMHSVKDLAFGPDGNLYATDNQHSHVERYDGTTGVKIDRYVSGGTSGLDSPQGLVFGPDDKLYVTSQTTDEILRFEGPFGVDISCNGKTVDEWEALGYTKFVGTPGNDVIVGTTGNDIIVSLDGDDDITAKSGDDIICGGDGNNHIHGEIGNDVIITGNGDDDIDGNQNDDKIYSGAGNDIISAGNGDDTVDAGDGDNYVEGNPGADVITTGTGDDKIYGGDGIDTISAGSGDNYVEGNQRADIISSESGDDTIYGGSGDDTINAGDGDNYVEGNPGADVITTGTGDDDIYGGNGEDVIDAGDGDNYVDGGSHSDIITAGSGDDDLNGSGGNDCINSVGGSDTIDGGSGTNSINLGSCDGSPILTISSPSDGDSFDEGDLVTFSGTAIDPEDGDISDDITWTCDLHGVVGTASSISSTSVPVGVHPITASITDSDGNTSTQSFTYTVGLEGYPTISINEPADSFIAIDGTSITFSGTAVDPEDGGLSNKIKWNSDIDGYLGVDSFSDSTLSVGTHTITATVTDMDGNTSSISIVITIKNEIILEKASTLICHFPPGNPGNHHDLMITPSSLVAHKSHGDKLGQCESNEEKRMKLLEVKKQREEIRDKNELKEKRNVIKEIKNELKDLKNLDVKDKEKLKELVEDVKEVLQKLKEDPEFVKEHKKILKSELKETKSEIVKNMTPEERVTKQKVESKIHTLSKSDDPKFDAKKLGLDYKDGKTTIALKLSSDDQKVLREIGSVATIDAKNNDHVQVKIKLEDLPKLRAIDGIKNIRAPFTAIQFEEELSEGVYFMNADLAQYQGITGKGVKVAVLDLSFTNNPKISDNIVEVKSFRAGVDVLPIQWYGDEALHGTAVAEIITDVAPNAELYLYSMETDVEFANAVDWAISKKLDIIVMSAGWPNFPTDGKSHITKKIEEAVDNGIVFVVPAGNFANKHWEGSFVDSNFNNWHDYSDSDEGLSISVSEQRIEDETPIIIHLMWDVKNADVADFELVLVDPLGQIVAFSANEQLSKSDTPFEYIYHIPEIEGVYSVGVLYAGDMSVVSQRPSATLELFSINDELEHPVIQSSVSVPADADGAIVVGAINHLDGVLEPFSSQGPTNNGRLAPHVVGPDGVTTMALEGKPFFGTSATTPYVAGLAALILETSPDISPKELLTKIQQNTGSSLFSLKDEFDYSSGYGPANAFFLIEDQEVTG